MSDIEVYSTTTGGTVSLTIQDPDDAVIDITGGTVLFLVEGLDDGTCTISDGTAGAAYYVLPSSMSIGHYRAQAEFWDSTGNRYPSDTMWTLEVKRPVNG